MAEATKKAVARSIRLERIVRSVFAEFLKGRIMVSRINQREARLNPW
jgi:hypothetical protein